MDHSIKQLSPLASVLVTAFEKSDSQHGGKGITVNPVVATFASWYEKIRNAMDYREDEVILRAAIERIIKRKILFGDTPEKIAGSLTRELVWARYFPDEMIGEAQVAIVEERLRLFLTLRKEILARHKMNEGTVDQWMYHIMSSDIAELLNKNKEVGVMNNFMFQIMRSMVTIEDDTEQTRDVQVYIAVRRAFARDDIALLRYHLFIQIYGTLSEENLKQIAENFPKGYKEIQSQLHYPKKESIYFYIKKKAAVFFILEDILRSYKGDIHELSQNEEELRKVVYAACEAKYQTITSKVRRAIIRSVIFILMTKAIFAFVIEGTYENIFYGGIQWTSLILNIAIPPILMIFVGMAIKSPNEENSRIIFRYIMTLLFEKDPKLGKPLSVRKVPLKRSPVLDFIFMILGIVALTLSFGTLIYILRLLHFNIVNQGIFLFFLVIVSFLCYRISLIPLTYKVEDTPGLLTPVVDFFIVPIVRVGRNLTEGIAQVNIFLFIFDFFIETPFKSIFGFFEEWFLYLHSKRENLG